MPRGDGTGPNGMGAMTGRGAGYCAGAGMPGALNARLGRGFGAGFGSGQRSAGRGGGGGHGRRFGFNATGLPGWMRFGGDNAPYQRPDPEMEKQVLRNQASALQTDLDFVRKRLGEIEKENP